MAQLPPKPIDSFSASRRKRDDSPARSMASGPYRRDKARDDRGGYRPFDGRRSPPRTSGYYPDRRDDSYSTGYSGENRYTDGRRDGYRDRSSLERDRARGRDAHVAGDGGLGRARDRLPWDRERDRDGDFSRDGARGQRGGRAIWDRERDRDSYSHHDGGQNPRRERDRAWDSRWEGPPRRGRSPRHDELDRYGRRSPPPFRRRQPLGHANRRSPLQGDSYVARHSPSPSMRSEGHSVRGRRTSPPASPRGSAKSDRDREAGNGMNERSRSRSRTRRRNESTDSRSVGALDHPRGRRSVSSDPPGGGRLSPAATRNPRSRSTEPLRHPSDELSRAENLSGKQRDTKLGDDHVDGSMNGAPAPVILPEPQADRIRSPHPPSAPRRFARTPPNYPSGEKSPHARDSVPARHPNVPQANARIPTGPRFNVALPPPPRLPEIPVWKPRPSLTPELDAELVRLQQTRVSLLTECSRNALALRRTMHELEMAAIDLRAAEQRRKIADLQLEQARAGMLGMDAEIAVE